MITLVKSFVTLVAFTTVATFATTNTQARFNAFDHPNVQNILTKSTSNFTTMSLSSIGSEFTTLTHPDFPFHSLRIKKAPEEWCDPGVNKYTGYIDITPARHLWFYFFESRSNPAEDDVVLWTNGGPGGSSSMGLFMELGPCQIDGNSTKVNPYSWNELSNIFFIDQPIGTVPSYLHYDPARLSGHLRQVLDLVTQTSVKQSPLQRKARWTLLPSLLCSSISSIASKVGLTTWQGSHTL